VRHSAGSEKRTRGSTHEAVAAAAAGSPRKRHKR
jgi:hypothetical protein